MHTVAMKYVYKTMWDPVKVYNDEMIHFND